MEQHPDRFRQEMDLIAAHYEGLMALAQSVAELQMLERERREAERALTVAAFEVSFG